MTEQAAVVESTARALLARLAAVQRAARLPSVSVALVRDGAVCWSASRGEATGGPPAGPDLQYRIGSITKTLTAVRVLQLAGAGALDLDTRVGDVLGDIGYADRTVRSLLSHSSGMQSEPVGSWWERSPGGSWEELAAAHDGSLAVLPGERRFHYSNLGFALLGRVTEVVSGEPWWSGVRERVLAPLGMDRTSYLPEPPAAQGFSVDPYAATLHPEPATDTGAMAPAGQVWSTTADLARYAVFLLEGHPDVLPLEVLLTASHPQSGDRHDELTWAQGLGFALARGGSGMLVGHTGSMPGFLAGLFVDRGRGTGGVLLANGTTGTDTLPVVRGLLERLEEHEPTIPAPWRPQQAVPPELADVLGVWHWGNTPLVFALEEGLLVAREGGEQDYSFAVRDGRIVGVSGYHTGETLHVRRGDDGSVSHLEIATFVYTRSPGPHPSGR
ncbi:serine hydrolase domain-containing protein [Nocardioides sp.]|uniref:serine hydrolase domain-containing protein n=1 Tax=Nocardioides sp. TaxID=35761 RepID=UPI003528729F